MIKFQCNLVLFFLMILNFTIVAQTTAEVFFPEDLHGTVKLNISGSTTQNRTLPDYNNLAIFVKNEGEKYESNAIQGKYSKEGDFLIFKPYFPFESGMTYNVRTKKGGYGSTYSYQSFQIGQKKKVEQAKVVSIYPSACQLPENLLRFYIYFNTPMKKGQALNHIQLTDAAGNIDHHAFMEFKQELWSRDGKRLTILFDPGRIKRGVSTNVLKGPALLEGEQFKLSISGSWQDINGEELSTIATKEFEVVSAYRHQMELNDWEIIKPTAISYDTLSIHFDRIIDHALIQSMIKIVDAKENLIPGYWEILQMEQSIKFIPKKKWKLGIYRIMVDSRLEDVAGNNLGSLLEHNISDKENHSFKSQTLVFSPTKK